MFDTINIHKKIEQMSLDDLHVKVSAILSYFGGINIETNSEKKMILFDVSNSVRLKVDHPFSFINRGEVFFESCHDGKIIVQFKVVSSIVEAGTYITLFLGIMLNLYFWTKGSFTSKSVVGFLLGCSFFLGYNFLSKAAVVLSFKKVLNKL